MKYKFYILLFACMVSFGTSSCKKEQITPSGYLGNGSRTDGDNYTPQTLNLVADDWKATPEGIWVHTFQHILHSNDVKNVNVYILKDGLDIPITQAIYFNGGALWATYNTTDVKINFRFGVPLPFSSLDVKVTVQ